MNYLAHVTLSEPTDEARLGALLGDFTRGLEVERLTETMRFALEEHRAIDRWFDSHPLVRAERKRFAPRLRRFSGILLDVFADHVLIRHWDALCDTPISTITESAYRGILENPEVLPPRLARIGPSMARDDWLGSYGAEHNVERALHGIQSRMRRETPIAEGIDELRSRRDEIEACVLEVWPLAVGWVQERRKELGR